METPISEKSIEDNPGNKFLRLLAERRDLCTYECFVNLSSLEPYFKSRQWMITIDTIRGGCNSEILVGELPLITNQDLREIIRLLIDCVNTQSSVQPAVLNYLLKEAGTKFRVLPVPTLVRLGSIHDNYETIIENNFEVFEIA